MAHGSPYPVVIHQGKGSKDSSSVNSMATRSSTKSRPSSIISNDSYTTDSASMWSEKEATLIDGSKSRINAKTGQTVTVWNGR